MKSEKKVKKEETNLFFLHTSSLLTGYKASMNSKKILNKIKSIVMIW